MRLISWLNLWVSMGSNNNQKPVDQNDGLSKLCLRGSPQSDSGNPCYEEDFGWSNKLAYMWIRKVHILHSQTNKGVANLSSILIEHAFRGQASTGTTHRHNYWKHWVSHLITKSFNLSFFTSNFISFVLFIPNSLPSIHHLCWVGSGRRAMSRSRPPILHLIFPYISVVEIALSSQCSAWTVSIWRVCGVATVIPN